MTHYNSVSFSRSCPHICSVRITKYCTTFPPCRPDFPFFFGFISASIPFRAYLGNNAFSLFLNHAPYLTAWLPKHSEQTSCFSRPAAPPTSALHRNPTRCRQLRCCRAEAHATRHRFKFITIKNVFQISWKQQYAIGEVCFIFCLTSTRSVLNQSQSCQLSDQISRLTSEVIKRYWRKCVTDMK